MASKPTSPDSPMDEQLETLTTKLLDGSLLDAECDLLNELLREEFYQAKYVEICKLHYCLAQRRVSNDALSTVRLISEVHGQILDSSSAPSQSSEVGLANRLLAEDFPEKSIPHNLYSKIPWGLAAAIMLVVLGFLTFRGTSNRPDQDSGQKVAGSQAIGQSQRESPNDVGSASSSIFAARVVAMSEDIAWESSAKPKDFLLRLSASEWIKLARGVAKIEFASGAFAVLTAPGELQILGPDEALLQKGKLTGESEDGNFVVQTPSAYVVDIGTAFGVYVDGQDKTEVVVFEGEVHVRQSAESENHVRLTSGMAVRVDDAGISGSGQDRDVPTFDRDFKGDRPATLGVNELSLVDIISGSVQGEYRSLGSIDPDTGTWAAPPWSESKGVTGKVGKGRVVAVDWNPWVHGIFIPDHRGEYLSIDLEGGQVKTPDCTGDAWGPVWARRRIDQKLDPLADRVDRDVEGFWGAGTTTALLDRTRWVRDGIVGLHANVGLTIDLEAIRRGWSASTKTLRGVLAHLERSHVSQPFHPDAKATFQIYVDGELRYERDKFCRRDGDAIFGVDILDADRFLTLLVTDGGDGPIYDRVILIDTLFELNRNK